MVIYYCPRTAYHRTTGLVVDLLQTLTLGLTHPVLLTFPFRCYRVSVHGKGTMLNRNSKGRARLFLVLQLNQVCSVESERGLIFKFWCSHTVYKHYVFKVSAYVNDFTNLREENRVSISFLTVNEGFGSSGSASEPLDRKQKLPLSIYVWVEHYLPEERRVKK